MEPVCKGHANMGHRMYGVGHYVSVGHYDPGVGHYVSVMVGSYTQGEYIYQYC